MALTALKTWVAGEVLTASDLNSEFLNVYNGGQTLGWPAEANKDFDGYTIVLDADGDTTMTAGTVDDRVDYNLGGVLVFQLDGTVASPVNGVAFVSSATGVAPQFEAFGSDTDVGLNLVTKGAGAVQLNGDDLGASDQVILPQQIFG
jgi:hypothetical protein